MCQRRVASLNRIAYRSLTSTAKLRLQNAEALTPHPLKSAPIFQDLIGLEVDHFSQPLYPYLE